MMKRIWIGIAVMTLWFLVPLATAQTQPSESKASGEIAQQLIGTWRLLTVETIRPNGEILTQWMGKAPTGLISYEPNGLMAVQIMRDPRPTFERGSRFQAGLEELKSAYFGYYAYWGTYTVSEADNTVIHNVQASLLPEEVGTTFKRFFAFDGPRLVLTTPPQMLAGEERKNRLTWERIK
jgi:hypothetical protein